MLQENILLQNIAQLITYISLATAIALCFFDKNKKTAIILFIFSVLLGLFCHQFGFLALTSILGLGSAIYLFYQPTTNSIVKFSLFWVILILSALLFIHKIPGYYNWKIYDHIILSENSSEFEFWLSFDKSLIGFFLLFFGYNQYLVKNHYKEILLTSWPFFVALTIILITCGLISHYIIFDPKLPSITLIWILKMIFFTAIVEEAFFRLFIQDNIILSLKALNLKYSKILGLILASLIFSVFHFAGGLNYMILAFIAGLLYGGVYLRSGFLVSSIALHFFINFVHFIFFSYPHYQYLLQPSL